MTDNLKKSIPEHLPRLLLCFLLSAGLSLTVTGMLDLSISPALLLGICLGLSVLLEVIALSPAFTAPGAVIVLALGVFFVDRLGGMDTVSDVVRALTLHLSGTRAALPLVGNKAAILFCAVITLLSFLFTRPFFGSFGALTACLACLLALWLGNRADLIWYLLPALITALTLILRDRHEEVALFRLLPFAAVICLIACALTPASGLIWPELKDWASDFRQSVMDRLFFTEPRDVFSLASEGFYPQGSGQLGGSVTLSDHTVMQVSTPRSVYLRGVTMNEYTGRAWRNTLGGRRYLWEASGMNAQRRLLFDEDLPSPSLSSSLTQNSDITIRMLSDGCSTLFVPQRIRSLRAGGDLVPYFTGSSEVFITRNLQEGDTWSVSAPLFRSGDAGLGILVDAAASAADSQYNDVLETYTLLPDHLEQAVRDLAYEITSGISGPYDRALAIESWLRRNYRYTLTVADQPADVDFVTNFLFNTKEGYCTYFASAMTVLCRMAGLPARYVEGYLAEPDETGNALVTGKNAHAWTEVYFKGFGWLTFDATPRTADESDGTAAAAASPEPEVTPTPEPDAEEVPTESPSPTPDPEDAEINPVTSVPPDADEADERESDDPLEVRAEHPWRFLWLLLLLIPLAIFLRWRLTDPAWKASRAKDELSRFDIWTEDVRARLSAAGYTRTSGETPMSFTRALDEKKTLPVSLSQLGECVSLLHFSKSEALDTDTSLAKSCALSLKKLPRKARLGYAARRLLPRRKQKTEKP